MHVKCVKSPVNPSISENTGNCYNSATMGKN